MRTIKLLMFWGALQSALTGVAIFKYGDRLADTLFVVAHRLKNAATPVASDGMVSLVALEQIDATRREEAAKEDERQLVRAEEEAKAARLFRDSPPRRRR